MRDKTKREEALMPSKKQMLSVGQSCSEYEPEDQPILRSCESCAHWTGEDKMCKLDIFVEQLTSLDQT